MSTLFAWSGMGPARRHFFRAGLGRGFVRARGPGILAIALILSGLFPLVPGLWGQGLVTSPGPTAVAAAAANTGSPAGSRPDALPPRPSGPLRLDPSDLEAAWISPGTLDLPGGQDLFSTLDWQPAASFSASLPGWRVLRTVISPDGVKGPGYLLVIRSAWPGDTRVYVQDISTPRPVRLLPVSDASLPVRVLPAPGPGGLRVWITASCQPGQALPGLEILAPPAGGKADNPDQDTGTLTGEAAYLALGAGIGIALFLILAAGLLRKPVFAVWALALAWIVLWLWLRVGGGSLLAPWFPLWLRTQADLIFLAPLAGLCLLGIAIGPGAIRSPGSRFWTVSALANLVFLGVVCLGSGEISQTLLSTVFKAGLGLEFLAMAVLRLPSEKDASKAMPQRNLVTRLGGIGGLCLVVLHLSDPDSVYWLIGPVAIPGPALWLVLLATCGMILSAGAFRQLRTAQAHEAGLLEERDKLEELLRTALQGMEVQKAEILRLSEVDDETGLVRKEAFLGHVEREQLRYVRYSDPFSLMIVELDHLKQFRIDYSEQTVQAGRLWFFRTIKAAVRKSDLVCRFGDGSVVFLMPGTRPLQAMIAAEKFRTLIQESCKNAPDCPSILQGKMTVSIGVAAPRKAGQDLHRFIQELEDSLTKARLAGGNRAALSPLALKDEEGPGIPATAPD